MIYFVSDIHLGAGDARQARRTERAFGCWLDLVAKDATALYLLGDIFDFWFEYHRVVPKGFVRIFARLAELSDRGVRVVFFTGNHDMWCYDYLTEECGVEVVKSPRVETLQGVKLHLAHGDNMNVQGDVMLKLMNAIFRSGVARWLFSWLVHPDLALKFGKWWSGKSRKSHAAEDMSEERLGYLIDYAREHHRHNEDVVAYLFGHMHYAHRHSSDVDVLFMSDWSNEVAHYIVLEDNNRLEIKTFTIEEAIA